MKTIKIWSDSPSDRQLNEISEALAAGETMIFPTDTLYAIGCDALNVKAIEKICRLKGINPEKSNLSIICKDISMASEYCRIDDAGFRLLRDYTPGPFTFLFKASSSLPKAFKGRKVVGIRIPDNNTDREIASYLGHPVLTTSIEYEDSDYGINPDLIAEGYEGKVDFIIEGEEGDLEPSTIIDCTGKEPVIVRQGKGLIEGL
ncbi:MAG: threonylcarbamoyl-AMP synthase [Muribaculaceae bacterium]|nr:threonylcarbamoyl-AMP synthase [Muribaculaceae bacterium]